MHIHERYKNMVIELVKKTQAKLILKTDCWNEAEGDYPIANEIGARCIEINQDRVKKAIEKFPNLVVDNGDIRKLPYEDKSFDMVIDLSTLDHVGEYEDVIAEYKRVLRDDGTLLLVAWTSTNGSKKYPHYTSDVDGKRQYFFDGNDLIKTIPFKNIETGVFPGYDNEDKLIWYICND